MAKYPSIQLYTGDWLKDPRLSMCTPQTRGIWIDLVCSMHELNRCGKVEGTLVQLSRIARCSEDELNRAIVELSATKTADVTVSHEIVTVKNRRMFREFQEREHARKRKQKQRVSENENTPVTGNSGNSHADVTATSQKSHKDVTSLSSSSTSKNPPISPLGGTVKPDRNAKEKEEFNVARGLYPGTIRGNDTEFEHFLEVCRKKKRKWKDEQLKIIPAIQYQIDARKRIEEYNDQVPKEKKIFIAPWKNFKTWLNQLCWEEKIQEPPPLPKQAGPKAPDRYTPPEINPEDCADPEDIAALMRETKDKISAGKRRAEA